MAPVRGVEPRRSTFVASSPNPSGHGQSGCSPRCQTEPPLIWQLSRVYKAPPHAGADDKPHRVRATRQGSDWLWRVDLHHYPRAYETRAPLFVLRHRKGLAGRLCLLSSEPIGRAK